MSRHREARRSRSLVAVVTAALLFVVANFLAGPGPTSSAQTPEPFTVTVSRTDGLADAQFVDVDVTMRSDLRASAVNAYICRPGQAYTTVSHVGKNGGNCPGDVPMSASGASSFWTLHRFTGDARARGRIVAGVGTAEWDSTITGDRFALTCGPDDPCVLVVRVGARPTAGGATTQYFDSSTVLTYVDDDPTASCGGAAPGALRSAGSDRIVGAWREWTRAQCGLPGGTGSATLAPIPDEGAAVTDFAEGERDIAYTAVGAGELGFTPEATRDTVATPVALNAVVLAAAGGHFTATDPNVPPTEPLPYGELRLTAGEVATMLGQGQIFLNGPEVLARNPVLGAVYSQVEPRSPMALASSSAVTLHMTHYLDELGGAAWNAGPAQASADRGVTANLGVPDDPDEPTFTTSLSIVSDQSAIDRAVFTRLVNVSPSQLGPQWVWTDLATATRLGMTPVSLPNAAGEWVAPTPASLAAAVPTMARQDNGLLAPNVAATAPGAYPLTMVEYALAPAEPLFDVAGDVCAPRTDSQELLGDWLGYITGDGQAVLPNGLVPLTPGLRTEATAAIPQVGATPSTTCVPGPPTTPTTQPPGTRPPGTQPPPGSVPGGFVPVPDDDSDFGSGGPSSDDDSSPHGGTPPRESTAEDREEAADEVDDAEIDMPPFLGVRGLNEVMSPLSLLLIVVLTSGAAFLTSGRELPEGARATGRAVARSARFTRRRLAAVRLPVLSGRGAP
ncbi:MAG TPA: hypothetical protein VK611_01405 [Acidimicrobiales bacterium]|nr:hypothetical protein [Acidimicrobiales bacterium]